MTWQVYIIYSKKLKRFYTGCTKQIENRLLQHSVNFFGMNSFTAKADDWELILSLTCRDEKHAKSVEKHIKQMKSSTYIQNLIHYPEMQQKLIDKY